jgi:hypothetical protein
VGSRKKDSGAPSTARINALDDRLSELRSSIGRMTPVIKASSSAAGESSPESSSAAAPATGQASRRTPEEEEMRLARTVFGVLKGDPHRVQRFVHELARLQAKARTDEEK